jgi:hypothetical protein
MGEGFTIIKGGFMKSAKTKPNKNHKMNWDDYEVLDGEPKERSHYDLSVDAEDTLLEHGLFLKHRVWRNMKKQQRHGLHTDDSRHLKEDESRPFRLDHSQRHRWA